MSSSASCNGPFPVPVTILEYRDIASGTHDPKANCGPLGTYADETSARGFNEESSDAELEVIIRQHQADAIGETTQRLQREYEQKLIAARAPIAAAVSEFQEQKKDYFARVEAEVVQLALAIAAKILHREAQVDPMMLATLVRMAIEKLREGSSVTVRVSPGRVASWRDYLAAQAATAHASVAGDAKLSDQDCIVETELGSANFGLDAQLKEVEQGFFDLLALRPTSR